MAFAGTVCAVGVGRMPGVRGVVAGSGVAVPDIFLSFAHVQK